LPKPGQGAAAVAAQIDANLADLANLAPDPSSRTDYQNARATVAKHGVRVMRVSLTKGAKVPANVAPFAVATTSTDASALQSSAGIEAAAAGSCDLVWYPNYVNVVANDSYMSGQRFAYVNFAWTTASRIDNFHACANPTFEPDLVTYNYDGLHYFSNSVQSWSSSMGNAYLDTKFADGANEPVFTVGTSRAENLVANHQYQTAMWMTNGNASTDTSKVVAQRGVRIPPGCTSTWCIFARASQRYPNVDSTWLTIPTAAGGWTWNN
jgi:hypothetical protein